MTLEGHERRNRPRTPSEGTRMLRRIEAAEKSLSGLQRTALQAIGILMVVAPLARFVMADLIGVGHHAHETSDFWGVARLLTFEWGPSLVIMWIGLCFTFPPLMVWSIRMVQHRIPGFLRRKQAS